MKTALCLVLSLALLLMPFPALAGCPTAYRGGYGYHQIVQEVHEVNVAVFQAIPVIAYGIGYVPPPVAAPPAAAAPAAQPDCATTVRRLEQRIADLEARLGRGSPTPPVPSPPPGAPADPPAAGLALMRAKCAACHSAETAAAKGKGLVLFNGEALAPLDARVLSRIYPRVYGSSMPPPGNKENVAPLTDAEVGTLIQFLDTLK